MERFKALNTEEQYYQIRLKGQLSPDWSDWFQGFTISQAENGDTVLSGNVKDQAALFGIFLVIQNLGMTLLSVNLLGSR